MIESSDRKIRIIHGDHVRCDNYVSCILRYKGTDTVVLKVIAKRTIPAVKAAFSNATRMARINHERTACWLLGTPKE
jgi:UDP-2,3-diacylglucosamine pyrophosphatase LpxH